MWSYLDINVFEHEASSSLQASGAEVQDSSMALQHRLQEAVEVCAMEHGRRYEELRLRWHLVQHAGDLQ